MPVLAVVLSEFNITAYGIGLVFALPMVISLPFAVLIFFTISYLNLRYVTFTAFSVSVIAIFL